MRVAGIMAVATLGLLTVPVPVAGTTSAIAQTQTSRPRITITPRQPPATFYPRAGAAFPGPGYVRDCVAWYEPEARPNGTVIVPRQSCGWVRGRS